MLYRLMKDNRLYFKGKGRKKTVSAQRNGIKISTEGENKVSVEKRWGLWAASVPTSRGRAPTAPFSERSYVPGQPRGSAISARRTAEVGAVMPFGSENGGRGPAGDPRRCRETKAAAMPSAMLRQYARIKETGPKDCCPSALPWVLWVWQALGRRAMPRLPL